jgi:hypothetical protein
MAQWVAGQSGNPNGRPRRGRSVAELARAIAQEKVEFTDGSPADGNAEQAVYSRLERLLRVMWTMALDGNLSAIRCLLEYMEGRPVQLIAAAVAQRGSDKLSAEDMNELKRLVEEKLKEWRREIEGDLPTLNAERSG